MIFVYSGTGNSRYVSERIASVTGDSIISLNHKIKANDTSAIDCTDAIIIVTPTYAWRLPKIVTDWIEKTTLNHAQKAWFVMTCGSEIGNAAKYNRKLCKKKHLEYMGTAQIVMPENYIAMFNAPTWDKAKAIIEDASAYIDEAAASVKKGITFKTPRNNIYDRIMSTAINPLFYMFCTKADAFYTKNGPSASSLCTGCGMCVNLCPLNNIRLKDRVPVWGKNCTQCMACISYCPTEAIEYGNKSKGKPRYQCRQ